MSKLSKASTKMEATGKKVQKLGGTLTLLLTVPIVLFLVLGWVGAVIGAIVFIIGLKMALKPKTE